MNQEIQNTKNYLQTLEDLKSFIKTAQIKAHLSVNKEMLVLYWQIGKIIINRQEKEGWGTKVTKRLSEDLQREFPNMKGLSYTNIRYMQRFAEAYPELEAICLQPIGKLESAFISITWSHNETLLDKLDDYEQRLWYAKQTIINGWSRNVLVHQINSDLYSRQAKNDKKINNFKLTLPIEQSDLAEEIIKDKYNHFMRG